MAQILRSSLLEKLDPTSDDHCVRPESLEKPPEGAGPGLDRDQTPLRSELREGHPRKGLRRVREHADLTAGSRERPQDGTRLGIPAYVHGGAFLGEAPEQDPPVAAALTIELGRGFAPVERESARFDPEKL